MNPDAPKNPQAQQPKKEHFIWDLVKFTVGALIIVIVIRTFVAQPFIVSGLSMYPTFDNANYLVIDELSYHFIAPARGDVLVFRYPNDPSIFYIKRIIGLPGETLVSLNGIITVYSNGSSTTGTTLNEPYIESDHESFDSWSVTLGPTQYWMMGDNRNESSDSRVWGPLDRSFFIGRPVLRLFPLNTISLFPGKESQ
jgi:signal peptidase I